MFVGGVVLVELSPTTITIKIKILRYISDLKNNCLYQEGKKCTFFQMNLKFKRLSKCTPSATVSIFTKQAETISVYENGEIFRNANKILSIPEPHIPSCAALNWATNSLLIGTGSNKVFIIDTNRAHIERILNGNNGSVHKIRANEQKSIGFVDNGGITDVTFSPDGSIFCTGQADGSVKLWSSHSVLNFSI